MECLIGDWIGETTSFFHWCAESFAHIPPMSLNNMAALSDPAYFWKLSNNHNPPIFLNAFW
jgi:hypothetical protein